jgi:hypothetical protein
VEPGVPGLDRRAGWRSLGPAVVGQSSGRSYNSVWVLSPSARLLPRVRAVLNPLRSEQEAFRFFLYVLVVVAVIVGIVLLIRAIT